MSELTELEISLQAQIDAYQKQQTKPQSVLPTKTKPLSSNRPCAAKAKKKAWKPKPKPLHRITLGVRKKALAHEQPYVHESFCVAQLDAELEAKKAAEEAGWHVAWVLDRERLY